MMQLPVMNADTLVFIKGWLAIGAIPAFIPAFAARNRGLGFVKGYILGLIFTAPVAWIIVWLNGPDAVALAKRDVLAQRQARAVYVEAVRQLDRAK